MGIDYYISMGILRLLFALAVLFAHALTVYTDGKIVTPSLAVPSFYVISGFYMALILNEKYIKRKNSYRLFIINRFLRIFPLYWLVLSSLILLSLIKYLISPSSDTLIFHMIHMYQTSFWAFVDYVFRNLSLLITSDYFYSKSANDGYLIVQQAPTLQCELLFYTLAPFLTRLKNSIFLLIWGLYGIAIWLLPFTFFVGTLTQTFVNSFIFFMLGIMSYKLFCRLKKNMPSSKTLTRIGLIFCLGIVLMHTLIFLGKLSLNNLPLWTYFGILVISIPFLFSWRNEQINFIGELSYPVYLTQFIVVKTLSNLPFHFPLSVFLLTACITTLIISWLLRKYIDKPIDKLRQKRFNLSIGDLNAKRS